MSRRTPKGELTLEYLDRFPRAGRKSIARKLCRDHPEMFDSIEAARSMIRYYSGSSGKRNRKKAEKAGYIKKRGKPGDPFPALPEPVELDNTKPLTVKGSKVLILADLHIPYHDLDALTIALKHGKEDGCDSVVLLGDVCDFFAVSRWVTDPRDRNLGAEIKATRQALRAIRALFPGEPIYYKLGNHEERWERYLFVRAPELVGLDAFEIPDILRLEEVGMTPVDRMRHLQFGTISLVHGHEFGRTIWNPVNAARGLFLRAKASAVCGHYHQSSEHVETNMNGRVVGCWSVGCLCDLKPRYLPYPKWNHGFATIERSSDNAVSAVTNHKILNGQIC